MSWPIITRMSPCPPERPRKTASGAPDARRRKDPLSRRHAATRQSAIDKELALIRELDYAPYFLTVNDIVAWARAGHSCQGRGSAANSAVCYCAWHHQPWTRPSMIFCLNASCRSERKEPPDIDVDFEHERREEVIQYVYAAMAATGPALTATVISYRPRSAMREVGKALGLTEDVTARLAGTVWGSWGNDICRQAHQEAGLDPDNPLIRRAVNLATQLIGFPRHLSQHVGGFVLTRGPLDETVPIGNAAMDNRTFIEWDKDDIDALCLMKVDVLALGMLTCIRKAFDLMTIMGVALRRWPACRRRMQPKPMTCCAKADSVGVFQVESRAQMNMLPRLKPRNLLRSRDRGGDCPTRPHSGRHGASLFAAAKRRGRVKSIPRLHPLMVRGRAASRSWAHQGRAAVSGAGDADRHGCCRIHRSKPMAAPRHGDLPQVGTIHKLKR
jgi:DNA polymerase III alpha subunit